MDVGVEGWFGLWETNEDRPPFMKETTVPNSLQNMDPRRRIVLGAMVQMETV